MSSSNERKLPTVTAAPTSAPSATPLDEPDRPRRAPMLWRVFAANAAVFILAFALLALGPVTIHASIRLDELVLLVVGLLVMLCVDLLLLRQVLTPLARLVRVMGTIDMLRPGQRANGFERSSSEIRALADAFNGMIERLEHERRESSARALAAQEGERLRIARELHDEIGQTLTAVALRAEHAAGRASGERPELLELATVVQETLEDVRRVSRELRPEALDELGLVNALIALCSRVEQQSTLRVRRELDGSLPALPADVELAIYRIAQEALTNAVRHAGASEVTVSLTYSEPMLTLRVSDNGTGLPEPVKEGGGLTGMRERALLIGGWLQFESAAGGGTAATLRLELDRNRQR